MIKLAVSACLLGHNVRYDGKNKRIDLSLLFPSDEFTLTAICPEVNMGMGIPRKPIQMINHNNQLQLVQVENPKIHFENQMKNWFDQNIEFFKNFSGFILKSKSPSCGNQTTPHFQTDGESNIGDGYFVYLLKKINPQIAIIDEVDLMKSNLSEKFKNSFREKFPDK
ncbi:MAG: DUF523 domain-containing protein [Xanthomonadales bacterium]|nr:DUF523 domain-containing protein [Xanthomonadales bacterium]